ncbi:homolog to HGPV1-ORF14 [Natrialba magadii ATCC 43099]|uniref:Homolog to HGPV1-ORF14 n=1 Tax=Natrialba magadii (strain ATCC 43099 / DSM 3394 / CCM 3739 / CIP 104546 / IAM 13178 / JCM 8861 / NBRC 102185 / NCIMB 2190 / MS3) TaxID=547559 RepID=D3SVT2_NATMM|nr:MarR family transcriptional regulator [Natrialba magadii]ADD03651.1 homolog to HGPV1-ORF14 [Natrialba magadii ATCC 43099]ELY34417.1 hypothetical protein C500_00742 [Natrialba magadii ATCC 43099]
MKAVGLAYHEYSANYLFEQYGLQPFFAADRRVKDGGGSQVAAFQNDGEQWVVKLYYQDSGIAHPGEDDDGDIQPGATNPQGTEFWIEEMREFRLSVARHTDEDPAGQQSFNAHLAPRWQGMQTENKWGEKSEFSVPDGTDERPVHEAVNIKINGSNIAFERYEELLREAAEAVGIHRRYFEDYHPHSNTQDAERYVRLLDERSGPVHARDGPIASLGHLLENDRSGYRKLVQNDRDEKGRNVKGYYHTATLGPQRVTEVFPSHTFPREVKHYYSRESASMSSSRALAHPKVGASYQVNLWDEKIGVSPDELEELTRQLDETVLSVLAEAGIPIHPGDDEQGDGDSNGPGRGLYGPFVADDYFDPTQEQDRNVVSLDLTQIRSSQESVVIKHLADGLSPVEWESLEYLVTDGGDVSPADIAEANDRHVDSVRRALNRIPELVEAEYGSVSLRSNHIAEMVHESVQEAKDATRRAVEAGAKAIEASKRGIDETTSALVAWCAKHGIDVDDRQDARLKLRMRGIRNVSARIEEAYRLWCDAGKDPARFRGGQVDLGERGVATVWHYL